jgi:DNA-binding transcriptional regulator YdaS (Cro superfamily)
MEKNPQHHLERLVDELGSQAAAAQALGIGPSYFGDLLRGRRNVSDRVLTKLGLRRIVVRERK